jgi:hypothetical protein
MSDTETRIVRLVMQDLAGALGSSSASALEDIAARAHLFTSNVGEFEQRVVDDIQQYLHDTFSDTTWPPCPYHPSHPLWYSEGWWTCAETGQRVARLGELSTKS